jgi:hypothetical protein
MLTNLNRNSNPNRKDKSTKIYICVYTSYCYSISSHFLFHFGLARQLLIFDVYRKKTSEFEQSSTSFLFYSDLVFGSRNSLLLLSSDFLLCSYPFGFAANISITNVVLIRNKTLVMIN